MHLPHMGPFTCSSLSGAAPTPVPPQAALLLGLSLPHHGVLHGPQSLKGNTAPVWVPHGWQYLLWHRAPPSKSAFPAFLLQCPLPHPSSISFPQTGLFTFLLTCLLFVSSCIFSHASPSVSHFVWSHAHPAPVPTTIF